MRKLDYNKIMYVLGIIFSMLFCVFTIKDYINYDGVNNSAPFYVFVIARAMQFMLPGIILLYMYNQNTNLKVSQYTVKSLKLQENNKFKIAHISDFHNTNSTRLKRDLIHQLEENKPNIVVITGDLIDSRRTNIKTASQFVKSISNIASIYYVLGNHESRLDNIEELEKTIQKSGTIIIRNSVIDLNKDIQIIGLDDPAFFVTIEEKIQGRMGQIVGNKLEELICNKNKYNILLTHRPELIDVYVENGVDLVFTGHAHGGQIRIPGIGGIIAPGQGFFPKYTRGVYKKKDAKLVVSRGIGNSKFPFRINNRPELVFVTLEGGKEYKT